MFILAAIIGRLKSLIKSYIMWFLIILGGASYFSGSSITDIYSKYASYLPTNMQNFSASFDELKKTFGTNDLQNKFGDLKQGVEEIKKFQQ